MNEIYDLNSLTKTVGERTTELILTEYLMLIKAKADMFDKITEALKHKSTSVEDIRNIINESAKDEELCQNVR